MKSRRTWALALAILAMFALDMVDADCFDSVRVNDVECSESAEGCACCLLSEGSAHTQEASLLVPGLGRAPGAASDSQLAGVRPVPYRPPLLLS
jgi:hypothetical protein